VGALRSELATRGFGEPAIDAAIDELTESRALDDQRYASNLVQRHLARGHGPGRIRQELKALRVEAELIDAALDDGADWAALCRQVRERRFGTDYPADRAEKAKQLRFLQYRGFSADHIRAAWDSPSDADLPWED